MPLPSITRLNVSSVFFFSWSFFECLFLAWSISSFCNSSMSSMSSEHLRPFSGRNWWRFSWCRLRLISNREPCWLWSWSLCHSASYCKSSRMNVIIENYTCPTQTSVMKYRWLSWKFLQRIFGVSFVESDFHCCLIFLLNCLAFCSDLDNRIVDLLCSTNLMQLVHRVKTFKTYK